ncbi:hypothetical protein GCM10009504_32090 [Pseudomonas laurentiana]|uniref:hypothetical protein n=1 Tax=Pseudomonas laurentiana TaxID=2364649 RepID=UPI001676C625|nr:hypothetical protein [Pseudomonas laurentiana]GGU72327.1 hypothetical protein GCM10009504_32090 [Pseudomonas laurentiana]
MSRDEQSILFGELPAHLQTMALFKMNTGVREQEAWIKEKAKSLETSLARVLRRHKKADLADRLKCLILLRNIGRDGVIRTLDPLHPMRALVMETL